MNTQPSKPDVWDDQRITDYVMGELTGDTLSSFESAVAESIELAEAVDQARQVHSQLESFYESGETMCLSEDRRAAVLESERSTPAPSRTGRKIGPWLALAAAACLAGIGLMPKYLPNQEADIAVAMTMDASVSEPAFSVSEEATVTVPAASSSSVRSAPFEQKLATNMPMDTAVSNRASGVSKEARVTVESVESSSVAPLMIDEASVTTGVVGGGGFGTVRKRLADRALEGSPARRGRVVLGGAVDEESVADVNNDGVADRYDREMDDSMEAELRLEDQTAMDSSDELALLADAEVAGVPVVGDFAVQPRTRFQRESGRQVAAPAAPMAAPFGRSSTVDVLHRHRPIVKLEQRAGDRFASISENQFRLVRDAPLSTFSIDVDTASYAKTRNYLLRSNSLPPADAVRIEELVNYFDYAYAGPDAGSSDPFAAAMEAATCPWNPQHRLVRVGVQAKQIQRDQKPQCNLVFLIDTSGSMQSDNKLPLVIEGLQLLTKRLAPEDRVAMVTYAGNAGLVLDSTPVAKKKTIRRALDNLQAGGSTNGGAGIALAYSTARDHFIQDGVNRVILCSDGDFNVGVTGTDALVEMAKNESAGGIELTVLGFGMGNHNDAMMEAISNRGAGNYAFVDTIAEAQKVLADQLTGTLVTVAKDVKIQVEFNPTVVQAYRLIGYENRLMAKEDFNDDKKDAGEIGAGHRVTALYEVVPVGVESDAIVPPVDDLKYQSAAPVPAAPESSVETHSKETLTLKIRYKPPQESKSIKMSLPLVDEGRAFDEADEDFRFAAAVASFGMHLRSSKFIGDWKMGNVITIAQQTAGERPLRLEFVEMVRAAMRLRDRR
ncbi:MAG: VWA domain-containing protein [Planctomycetota bacterium]